MLIVIYNAVLGIVDGIHIEVADDILRDMRLTIDDAHFLLLFEWFVTCIKG